MTTKPKTSTFRVRRLAGKAQPQTPAKPTAQQLPPEDLFEEEDDGFGDANFKQSADEAPPPPSDAQAHEEDPIAAVRAEGLSGRQLRLARRVAQKQGLDFANDYEAVVQLRKIGIDPFSRANMLELVESQAPKPVAKLDAMQMGTDVGPKVAQPVDDTERATEIIRIQRDIARRRRRKMALLAIRMFFFVVIPTLICGYYFYVLATPLYATKSEFVIQQADSGGASAASGLFSGTAMATQQDSTAVQSYLLSRDAFRRLDAELGFISHFSSDEIDALNRLSEDASNERAYKLYQRMVKIGYDPTEGHVKMEIIAAEPQVSQAFSSALIGYAEEQVDQLTARLRREQMEGAVQSFDDAERRMLIAQQRVVLLQEQLGIVSADVELSSRMSQIGAIETQLRQERLRLDQLLTNSQPNRTRVEVLEGSIERLEDELGGLRSGLTEGSLEQASLARISAELGVAQIELETRTALVQQAAQQLEMARIEANRQVRYLSNSVPPIAPDEATYPRAFENTLLAFLIFMGIYLMISLTASILREQVSA